MTLGGEPFVQRWYQFALAYSGWRHVEVILGGKSWVALSTGLQNALWAPAPGLRLGRVHATRPATSTGIAALTGTAPYARAGGGDKQKALRRQRRTLPCGRSTSYSLVLDRDNK